MPLQITPALESDIPQLMLAQFSAFASDIYHEALYPGGNNPAARAAAGIRVLKEWREEPHLQIVKCTDSATGLVVGFAKWEFYEQERKEEKEWRKEEVVDWAEEGGRIWKLAHLFLGKTYEVRWRVWGGRPHCLCALLCVHPDHQRRGAGTLLMQWGLDHAQKVGLPAYLEASIYGYPLYQRLGFHDIDKVVIKAEEWGGDYDKVYVAMVKDRLKET